MTWFVTGNKKKFDEARSIIPGMKRIDMEIPEIQEIDAKRIVRAKLAEALKHKKGDIVVEDTSLHLHCLGGLPGPLIKWFLKTIGNDGIYHISEALGNNRAEARTILGYAKNEKEIYFFEGSVKGIVVSPKGAMNFGWDAIFMPEGYKCRFSEMSREEKNRISMRKIAFEKLKMFLDSEKALSSKKLYKEHKNYSQQQR